MLPQLSAIELTAKRHVLRIILFALSKVLNQTAFRVPAFRERLRQRNVTAWDQMAVSAASWRFGVANSGPVRARRPRRK